MALATGHGTLVNSADRITTPVTEIAACASQPCYSAALHRDSFLERCTVSPVAAVISVTGCRSSFGAASGGYESLMASDADLGLSVEVIDVDGFAVRTERVELCPLLHPLDAALVVQLDLRNALGLRQIIE